MMELKDMGYKDKISTGAPVEAKQPQIRFPSFSLERNIPEELMGKDIGETCRLELVVKVVGKSINQYSENKNERIELEIHKLGYIGKAGKMGKEEYLNASDEEREKNDKENIEEDKEEEEE
jgi:hypothetical protein